jgi:hypothetical protein
VNDDEKRLARAAMQAQKVQLLAYFGAAIGGIVLPLAFWYLGLAITPDDMGGWFWLTLLTFPVGLFVGGRIALALMAQ